MVSHRASVAQDARKRPIPARHIRRSAPGEERSVPHEDRTAVNRPLAASGWLPEARFTAFQRPRRCAPAPLGPTTAQAENTSIPQVVPPSPFIRASPR